MPITALAKGIGASVLLIALLALAVGLLGELGWLHHDTTTENIVAVANFSLGPGAGSLVAARACRRRWLVLSLGLALFWAFVLAVVAGLLEAPSLDLVLVTLLGSLPFSLVGGALGARSAP